MSHWFRTYSDILTEFDSTGFGKPLKKYTFIYGNQMHDILSVSPANAMAKANEKFNPENGYWIGKNESPNMPENTYKWVRNNNSGSLFD